MTYLDWIIFGGYLVCMITIGVMLGKMVKNTSDLFAAGGQSPWWVSGLSGFMAMFSANTFVVWGGIAYKYGAVAIAINLCYGLSALAVGYTVAGKWKKLGIKTPAEYITKRFGTGALQFYTWFMMVFRILSSAGALYAFSTILLTILFCDDTGQVVISTMDRNLWILGITLVVIIYTMSGGLWAVLMTDTIQFIILNLAVIFVVPLSLMNIPDLAQAWANRPAGFEMPLNAQYSFYFLFGWFMIHYFVIGAELAYVQRYICVPSQNEAKKSAYLFGFLYLASPALWLLPPLIWRLKSPIPDGIDEISLRILAENAYILSCKSVLPSGMLGLMVAALFAATASMMSAQLNVFSGVLTHDIYRPLVKHPSERTLVTVGRVFTVLLGLLMAILAILIPLMGGVEKLIISAAQVMAVPILAPVMFSLFSKRLSRHSIFWCVLISLPLGLISVGIAEGWFVTLPSIQNIINTYELKSAWYLDKTTVGVVFPMIICTVMHFMAGKKVDSGWKEIQALEAEEEKAVKVQASPMPLYVVAWSMLVFTIMMALLSVVNAHERIILIIFTIVLAMISGASFWAIENVKKKRKKEKECESCCCKK